MDWLLNGLGSDAILVRQQAHEELRRLGSTAELCLRGRLSDQDPEIALRARELLLTPSCPKPREAFLRGGDFQRWDPPEWRLAMMDATGRQHFEQKRIEIDKHLRDAPRYANARMYDQAIQELERAETKVLSLMVKTGFPIRSPFELRCEIFRVRVRKLWEEWRPRTHEVGGD
jgi:hypothetical protein